MARTKNVKRYTIVLPEDEYVELQNVADRRNITILELLRRFIKLGILMDEAEQNPDAKILIQEGETEREVIFL